MRALAVLAIEVTRLLEAQNRVKIFRAQIWPHANESNRTNYLYRYEVWVKVKLLELSQTRDVGSVSSSGLQLLV